MTRRLRPPVPLTVSCDESGEPTMVHHAGHILTVTHIAATWVEPSKWWRTRDAAPMSETRHYRLVLDDRLIFETHRGPEGWQLDRILD